MYALHSFESGCFQMKRNSIRIFLLLLVLNIAPLRQEKSRLTCNVLRCEPHRKEIQTATAAAAAITTVESRDSRVEARYKKATWVKCVLRIGIEIAR